MRLLLILMLAMAMYVWTGCAAMEVAGSLLQGAGQGMQQASNDTSETKKQLECTPTYELNGNQRVYDCH